MMELFEEIIVDNFAGGGGASTGISAAIGRSVDIAINHDPSAIAMHKANHPDTEHYCEDVWNVDPREAVKGRLVGLCWFSPDCKHFSKAKGGKPVEKNIRGLAWVAVRWAATVRPRVIILENVEEFKTWGPLLKDGRPDPDKKGKTFGAFVNALKRLGYQVDFRELKACDYGAPTIRKRLFLIARNDGRPIVWPKPTHGDPNCAAVKRGRLKPWRTAAEIIDWSLPCPSIFERQRPLADNTLRRIARGIQRFVIDNPKPFIIKVNHEGEMFRGQRIDDPLATITAKNGWGLVSPHITKFRTGSTGHPLDEPLHTITSGEGSKRPAGAAHAMGMVSATLIQTGYGEREGQLPRVPGIDKPLGTVVAGGAKHAVVSAMLSPSMLVNTSGHPGSGADEPVRTITTGGHHALVSAYLVGAGGPEYMGKPAPIDEPFRTIITENHRALVTTFLSKYHGLKSPGDVRGHLPDETLRTLDTSNRYGLVAASLVKHYGGNYTGPGAGMEEPVPTVTTVDHNALVTSHLVKLKGDNTGQAATEPLHTITAGGLHFGEVRAFLLKYYGTATGQAADEPIHTITTKDRIGLVTIHGQDYQIVDIGMRMLRPRELFNAQAFPPDYIIDRDCDGKPFTQAEQVAKCGNSVSPVIPTAIVRANVPELCTGTAAAVAG